MTLQKRNFITGKTKWKNSPKGPEKSFSRKITSLEQGYKLALLDIGFNANKIHGFEQEWEVDTENRLVFVFDGFYSYEITGWEHLAPEIQNVTTAHGFVKRVVSIRLSQPGVDKTNHEFTIREYIPVKQTFDKVYMFGYSGKWVVHGREFEHTAKGGARKVLEAFLNEPVVKVPYDTKSRHYVCKRNEDNRVLGQAWIPESDLIRGTQDKFMKQLNPVFVDLRSKIKKRFFDASTWRKKLFRPGGFGRQVRHEIHFSNFRDFAFLFHGIEVDRMKNLDLDAVADAVLKAVFS